MKVLRKNIFRTGIIAFVCCGLLAAFCKPTEASLPDHSFADWLQSYAKIKLSPQIRSELNGLYQSNSDINAIFKKAEKILVNNEGHSQLPKNMTSEMIHQILLMKWNLHKTGTGMKAVSVVNGHKYLELTPNIKPLATGAFSKLLVGNENSRVLKKSIHKISAFLSRKQVVPLVDAISIGAP